MRKKFFTSMQFVLMLFICGCAQYQQTAEIQSSTDYNILKSVAETENSTETENEETYRKITIDVIRQMSEKHEALSLEDFSPFMDITTDFCEKKAIYKELRFQYNGEVYYLRVIASDKETTLAKNENALDAVVLFKEDFLGLEGSEEYSYSGVCADIRSGNLEHILSGNVEIEDYLTCVLPDCLKYSDFKYWLGTRGGVVFLLRETEEGILSPKNAGIFAVSDNTTPLQGGIEIRENGELERYENILTSYESLKLDDIFMEREIAQINEDGYIWYIARISKKNSTIEYCLYLNYDLYSEEDFLNMTESIQMKAHAIY